MPTAILHPVDTFVIRLWSPADHAAPTDDSPRGVARHVGTGRAAPFRDGDELIALLRDLPGRDERSATDNRPQLEHDGARHHD